MAEALHWQKKSRDATLLTNHKLNQDQIVSNAHAHSLVFDWFIAFSSYVLIGVNYLKLSI